MTRFSKRLRHLGVGSLLACFCLASSVVANASGSWSSQVPGRMIAMNDRPVSTQSVAPDASVPVGNGKIVSINWRYEAPPGAALGAWLCHPEQCVSLSGRRGRTQALNGLSAAAPLTFRFVLTPGQRPVRVQGLQVIVNYQQ